MHSLPIMSVTLSLVAAKLASWFSALLVLTVGLIAAKVLDLWYGGTDGETEHWE